MVPVLKESWPKIHVLGVRTMNEGFWKLVEAQALITIVCFHGMSIAQRARQFTFPSFKNLKLWKNISHRIRFSLISARYGASWYKRINDVEASSFFCFFNVPHPMFGSQRMSALLLRTQVACLPKKDYWHWLQMLHPAMSYQLLAPRQEKAL